MFDSEYSLRLQMPKCNPFAEKSSAMALLRDDLAEVLPYLNAAVEGTVYWPAAPAIMLRHGDHHVSIWPKKVLVSNLTGEAEAREVVEAVRELVNDVWARRDEIEPDHRGYEELQAMEAFKLLPGGNCKVCGEVACLPFAVKLVAREASIDACTPLFTEEHAEKREALVEALLARGYEVPAERL